jgi:regulator of nonsense transcripts 2
MDPPTDCFRIRLVCTLLDTCGHYFNKGHYKTKLDIFLTFFQRYILGKTNVPMDVDFMISDTLEMLRPHLERFETLEQANEAAAKFGPLSQYTPFTIRTQPQALNSYESHLEEEVSESEESEDLEDEEEDGKDGDGQEDEEEELEDEEDDDDDEEEEEEIVLRRPINNMPSKEDEEFDREFSKIFHESLESRKIEARNMNRMEMSIPINLIR